MAENSVLLGTAILSVSVLLACSPSAVDFSVNSGSPTEAAGIIGGEHTKFNSSVAQRTVLILRLHPTAVEGEFEVERCTGTLVSSQIVLTAAHCVGNLERVKTLVYFGANPVIDQEALNMKAGISVTHALSHPQGNLSDDLERVDLAFLRLEKHAPSFMKFTRLLSEKLDPSTEENALIAGFGKTTGGLDGDPEPIRLRQAELSFLIDQRLQNVRTQFVNALQSPSDSQVEQMDRILNTLLDIRPGAPYLWMDQTENKGACSGDSGGPLFIFRGGQVIQAGVASFSIQPSAIMTCRMTLAYANVSAHKEWLDRGFNYLNQSVDETLFVDMKDAP